MKRSEAKRIMLAIQATDSLDTVVFAQPDGANPNLKFLSVKDRAKVQEEAHRFVEWLSNKAGEKALTIVVGE